MAHLEITICICTHNRADILDDCLGALVGQDRIEDARVIVVNNNCTDNTNEVVESYTGKIPNLDLIFESQPGLSYARNRALTETSTPFVAYLDDDSVPLEGWLAGIIDAFSQTGADAVGGKVIPYWKGKRPWWSSKDLYILFNGIDLGDDTRTDPGFVPYGCNMAFKTDELRRYGGFDTGLGVVYENGVNKTVMVGEETAVCKAMTTDGRVIAYVGSAPINHLASERFSSLSWQRTRQIEGGTYYGSSQSLSFDYKSYENFCVMQYTHAMLSISTLHIRDAIRFYLQGVHSTATLKAFYRKNGSRSNWRISLGAAYLRQWRSILGAAKNVLLGRRARPWKGP